MALTARIAERLEAELAEARAQIAEANTYLERLLVSYVNEYCDPIPEWKPLSGDLIGMLTQIDNACTITGQLRAQIAAKDAALRYARGHLRENEWPPIDAALGTPAREPEQKPMYSLDGEED